MPFYLKYSSVRSLFTCVTTGIRKSANPLGIDSAAVLVSDTQAAFRCGHCPSHALCSEGNPRPLLPPASVPSASFGRVWGPLATYFAECPWFGSVWHVIRVGFRLCILHRNSPALVPHSSQWARQRSGCHFVLSGQAPGITWVQWCCQFLYLSHTSPAVIGLLWTDSLRPCEYPVTPQAFTHVP